MEALDKNIATFCDLTGENATKAREWIEQSEGNLETAVAAYWNDMEDNDADASTPPPQPSSSSAAPIAAASSSTSSTVKPPAQKKKLMSLSDLQNAGGAGGNNDDDDKEQEYFAGGDKSALAVQDPHGANNPRDHIQRLLSTARRNGPPPPEEEAGRPSAFSGAGQTLGGDDIPSMTIPDPTASRPAAPQMARRSLHLWSDGFSVDEGPLFRYDDPANARTLEMINRGSAPLDIMNVEPGQAVDVRLEQHRDQKFSLPKKPWKAFSSGGQRLGSPTPGISTETSTPVRAVEPTPAATSTSSASVDVNESEPIITLQIRLADGTRLPSRFNASHTIGDVYSFVDSASTASTQRAYSLATTFPTKQLDDKSAVLGDMVEFKRGGVVVQKWS